MTPRPAPACSCVFHLGMHQDFCYKQRLLASLLSSDALSLVWHIPAFVFVVGRMSTVQRTGCTVTPCLSTELWLVAVQSESVNCLVSSTLLISLVDERWMLLAPTVRLCHQSNCPQSAVEPSLSPLPNSGTACLTTSCWLIRCWLSAPIDQSINARFVGRRYPTHPGAPAIVICKHAQKVHSWVVSGMYSYQ